MRILEVIESKHWINKVTGQTASIYGSVPYFSESDKANWSIEVRGYTWLCKDGTIGLGRQPAKTRAEALEVMDRVNNLK